jgi:hypothetical protein
LERCGRPLARTSPQIATPAGTRSRTPGCRHRRSPAAESEPPTSPAPGTNNRESHARPLRRRVASGCERSMPPGTSPALGDRVRDHSGGAPYEAVLGADGANRDGGEPVAGQPGLDALHRQRRRAPLQGGTNIAVRVATGASLDVTTRMTRSAWNPAGGQPDPLADRPPASGRRVLRHSQQRPAGPAGRRQDARRERAVCRWPTANPVNTWTHVALTSDGSAMRLTSTAPRPPAAPRPARSNHHQPALGRRQPTLLRGLRGGDRRGPTSTTGRSAKRILNPT